MTDLARITKPAVASEQLNHDTLALPGLKDICREFKFGHHLLCMFVGARGNGQTVAAQAIATQLGLPLVYADLAAIVNKYIGETEKNLNRILEATEMPDAVLFFDEADALFGKRTEVQDSHGRYANLDTNYLLQRIEAFEGLVILATNMKQALDSAFVRRVRHVVINFPPGPR
jgi:SpoVK/Ycf46/Vps4 family AAA+-type ATPase